MSLVDGVPVLLAAPLLGWSVPELRPDPAARRPCGRGRLACVPARRRDRRGRASPASADDAVPRPRDRGVDASAVDMNGLAAARAAVVERARQAKADLILVGLGSPKGERWAAEARAALSPSVIVGIGAGLDFLLGAQRRAPTWLSTIGLEWLFRLAREPRRLWRRYLVRGPRFLPIVARSGWSARGAAPRPLERVAPAARPRVAFLTPEFPGQTHSFIWRERLFLQEAGLDVSIVSTRPPPAAIVCQGWAPAAQAETGPRGPCARSTERPFRLAARATRGEPEKGSSYSSSAPRARSPRPSPRGAARGGEEGGTRGGPPRSWGARPGTARGRAPSSGHEHPRPAGAQRTSVIVGR